MSKFDGQKFGHLLVLATTLHETKNGSPYLRHRVRCDCGDKFSVYTASLKAKNPMCRACRREKRAAQRLNGTKHPLYPTWNAMLQRCSNSKSKAFKYYGARGVTVCERWRRSFRDFVTDMGPRPPGYCIDRVDFNGPYSPKNCRWASKTEQIANRRMVTSVTHFGEEPLTCPCAIENKVHEDCQDAGHCVRTAGVARHSTTGGVY